MTTKEAGTIERIGREVEQCNILEMMQMIYVFTFRSSKFNAYILCKFILIIKSLMVNNETKMMQIKGWETQFFFSDQIWAIQSTTEERRDKKIQILGRMKWVVSHDGEKKKFHNSLNLLSEAFHNFQVSDHSPLYWHLPTLNCAPLSPFSQALIPQKRKLFTPSSLNSSSSYLTWQ